MQLDPLQPPRRSINLATQDFLNSIGTLEGGRSPQEFAPFVNLVRQSLLENVFCLIGFSGDDPNFLHWIGWVRDMLDEHALPIYLFVHVEPSLGQRRLLEARRIVPVVVPLPTDCDELDFRTRYQELFRILRTPLKQEDGEWANFSVLGSTASVPDEASANLQKLVSTLPTLIDRRASYPGWVVAPASVRRNFDRSLRQLFLHLESPFKYGLQDYPHSLVAVFAYYVWQQDVLMGPLVDDIAIAAVAAIEATREYDAKTDGSGVLSAMGITDRKSFRKIWIEAGIGALRWARKELRLEVFVRIKALLEVDNIEKVIADEIEHEAVLLDLYLGDTEAARKRLAAWRPGSVDPYMLVRKGSLISEVGEADDALSFCMSGIKQLREAQKVGRQSPRLISREAWGCLVAHKIQEAKKFALRFLTPDIQAQDAESLEDLGIRLSSLAAKGFDVRREYEEILSELNAEAQRPSVPRYRFYGFDLGSTNITQRFGIASELRSKIDAAECFLNIADKVGIAPRIGNVRFAVDAYIQAAWWIQYHNTHRRMLSIAIRTGAEDILKPKDETVPQHKTGWLSRYQVARTEIEVAREICDRALVQVELALASTRSIIEVERTCKFNIELFSRLVIRISQVDVLKSFAQRVIAIHCDGSIRDLERLWAPFRLALERTFEAIPATAHFELLEDLIQIPLLPDKASRQHYLDDWVRPFEFLSKKSLHINPDLQTELDKEIASLIEEISIPEHEVSDIERQRRSFVWARLFALDGAGCIKDAGRDAISVALWRDVSLWPVLPKFHAAAALRWAAPTGVERLERFRKFILKSKVKRMATSSAAMVVTHPQAKRAWGFPVQDDFFRSWIAAQKKGSWPQEDVIAGLELIKDWWDEESLDIEKDIERIEDLRAALAHRICLFDEILELNAAFVFARPSQLPPQILEWISLLTAKCQSMGCPMWRFRRHEAVLAGDGTRMDRLQNDLSAALLSTDSEAKWDVIQTIRTWINDRESNTAAPALVLDTVFSVIAARRMPGLWHCIGIAEEILRNRKEWMTHSRFQLLGAGMTVLFDELDYGTRAAGTDIPDELIPLLRFYSARLAHAVGTNQNDPEWAGLWIDSARTDPLPELRHMERAENAH